MSLGLPYSNGFWSDLRRALPKSSSWPVPAYRPQTEAILSACVFQGNVVEEVVDSGQKMAEEALFPVK